MTSKFRSQFVTPWNYMRAREELIGTLFSCQPLEPLAPPGSITYFGSHKIEKETASGAATGYDRLHDRSPYDQTKPRCDRTKQDIIQRAIHEENKRRTVAVLAEHWYGRPNRVQLDFPDGTFYRSGVVKSDFYRRNNVNLSTDDHTEE